ncbi:MAG: adenylate kinase [bacterium]
MKLIIVGPPGAGKGTQSVRIADELNIPRVVTGDILRESIRKGSPLGLKAKAQMDSGGLVSDDLVIDIVKEKLDDPQFKDNFLLDGFPRNINQALVLDKYLAEKNQSIDIVVEVSVSDDVIVDRLSKRRICLSCGKVYNLNTIRPAKESICDACSGKLIVRDDDKPDVVKKRLEIYHALTQPLINFYEDKGVFTRIDGAHEIGKVYRELLDLVDSKIAK